MATSKRRARSHHRRRKMGALSMNPKNPVIMLAAVAGGYLMSDQLYSLIDKAIPTTTTAATATTPAVVENVVKFVLNIVDVSNQRSVSKIHINMLN